MPVGSLLVELLSDDRPRGRRRCVNARAASRESLLHTNLSRSPRDDVPDPLPSGRRVFPHCGKSSVRLGVPSAVSATTSPVRSAVRRIHRPDQLGNNMMGKYNDPVSPRHKVYVKPPGASPQEEDNCVRRRSHAPQDHLKVSNLVPRVESPKQLRTPEPMILKPKTTGIRIFNVIPGEQGTPRRQGVRMVPPPESYRRQTFDLEPVVQRAPLEKRKYHNQSHFTLTHSDNLYPPNTFRRTHSSGSQRSSSVDIISWRNVDTTPRRSSPLARRRAETPRPRNYNIISNLPIP